MSEFKEIILLITGGTGIFGNAVINRFFRTDIGKLGFSRVTKNRILRHDFQTRLP